ncbi:hypothetical protein ABEB36_004531 [Hypothenemus hampei]|uniref:EF-hand domain-containing protein n=1 Tax=Hypothenemus hampei TaxID=57062 RepID=A0ABD1F3M9_HYPHA
MNSENVHNEENPLSVTSSYEEGDLIDYAHFTGDEQITRPPKNTEYYFQEYPYAQPTQSDFNRKLVKGSKLFDKTQEIKLEESVISEEKSQDVSILVTGFGMRNVDSFQKLVKISQEERRKWELRKLWRDELGQSVKSREEERLRKLEEIHSSPTRSKSTDTSGGTSTKSVTSDSLIQTDTKYPAQDNIKKHLDYLLGLETSAEEMFQKPGISEDIQREEPDDGFKYSMSKSVKEAQSYLREHRIFECFQFIVAHLLSANPENPIDFILNLLNKCILYRSGLGQPPLLYEKKHIAKLFDLMDRLQSGSIDMQQYVSGMKTFGICTFNDHPEVNSEGCVTKDRFVNEVYEAEEGIFNDLIRRRPEKNKLKCKKSSSTFHSVSIPSLNPPYFIPSDLFKKIKRTNDIDQQQQDDLDG